MAGQQGHYGAQAQLEQRINADHGRGGIAVFVDKFVEARAQLGVVSQEAGEAVCFIVWQGASIS